jgi:hypothetical protein
VAEEEAVTAPNAGEPESPEDRATSVAPSSPDHPNAPSTCPADPHLHVVANRRFGFPLGFMELGYQIATGMDPWNFSSHCPQCGKLIRDRNGRRMRCDGAGCDSRWEVPRSYVKAARAAALRSPTGESFTILTQGV